MRRRNDPLADELAALDELEVEVRRSPRRHGSLIVPILVTFVVMAGAVTIAWYSYTAGVKEGSEEAAPLLRPSGPMKVAPANPGGLEIPHREKTVFNAIDGRKSDRRVERLLPPPERPMPVPSPKAGDKTLESKVRRADRDSPLAKPNGPKSLLPEGPNAPSDTAAKSAPAPGPDAAPAKPEEAPAAAPKEAPAGPVAGKAEDAGKPARAKQTAAATPDKPPAIQAFPAAAYGIQIGSVSSEPQADKFWRIHTAKHGDLLGKLSMRVQKATIKGRAYYRVQAGPLANRSAANGLCDKLKKRQIGCIVVAPKK